MCVRYRLPDDSETEDFPAHQSDFHHCRPVFEVLPGWGDAHRRRAPGRGARRTSSFVEQALGVPVTLVGTGRRARARARAAIRAGQSVRGMYSSVNSEHRPSASNRSRNTLWYSRSTVVLVRCEVARHADRDGAFAVDCPRLVLGAPRSRRVGLLEPVGDDRRAALDDLVALVPRVVPVRRVVAEERADFVGVIGSPRVDVACEPLRHGRLVHGRQGNRPGAGEHAH